MSEIDQLVKMANQIANNLSFHDDAPARVADHLQRFWAPSMRLKLQESARTGNEDLRPLVKQALERMAGSR